MTQWHWMILNYYNPLDTVVILRDFYQSLGRWTVPTVPRLSALKATWACLPPCPQHGCCQKNQETRQQGSTRNNTDLSENGEDSKITFPNTMVYPWYILYIRYAPKITTIIREHDNIFHDHPLNFGPVTVMRSHNSVSTGLLLAIFDDFQDGSERAGHYWSLMNSRLLVYNLSIYRAYTVPMFP